MCRAACAENGDGRRPREPLECGGSARVAELADAPDLGSGALGRVGSSPTLRTNGIKGLFEEVAVPSDSGIHRVTQVSARRWNHHVVAKSLETANGSWLRELIRKGFEFSCRRPETRRRPSSPHVVSESPRHGKPPLPPAWPDAWPAREHRPSMSRPPRIHPPNTASRTRSTGMATSSQISSAMAACHKSIPSPSIGVAPARAARASSFVSRGW